MSWWTPIQSTKSIIINHYKSKLKKDTTYVTTPTIANVSRFSFFLSQTYLILTQFIEKCTNTYDIKLVSLKPTMKCL